MSDSEGEPDVSSEGEPDGRTERCESTGGGDYAGSDGRSGGRPCPICEEPMYSRHCKYVCPRHGVVYDCSDTFY